VINTVACGGGDVDRSGRPHASHAVPDACTGQQLATRNAAAAAAAN